MQDFSLPQRSYVLLPSSESPSWVIPILCSSFQPVCTSSRLCLLLCQDPDHIFSHSSVLRRVHMQVPAKRIQSEYRLKMWTVLYPTTNNAILTSSWINLDTRAALIEESYRTSENRAIKDGICVSQLLLSYHGASEKYSLTCFSVFAFDRQIFSTQ